MILNVKPKNNWQVVTESFLPRIRELTQKLEQLEKAKNETPHNLKKALQLVNNNERR